MLRPCVVLTLAISLSACAMPFPGSTPVVKPASTILNATAVAPREGAGAILVVRDRQLQGMDCVHDVSLDEKPVAQLRAGEQLTLYADPGDRLVTVSVHVEGKCTAAVAQVPLLVTAYATTKVHVRADGYYGLKVEATTY
jgi:hypothetical protein